MGRWKFLRLLACFNFPAPPKLIYGGSVVFDKPCNVAIGDWFMGSFDVSKVRTVAVLGHQGSGKTSLLDSLLFVAGATPQHGRVAQGTSVADYTDEERARKMTIHMKALWCEWNAHRFYLLDTPGAGDFVGETISAIHATDAAIIVVDGVEGVGIGTRRVWRLLEDLKKPRLFFVSKLDHPDADFDRTVAQIRQVFGKGCVPIEIPEGKGPALKKVDSLLVTKESEVGAEVKEQFVSARESLAETVAEEDDNLLEKYLGGEKLSDDELVHGARNAELHGHLIPILCGTAEKDIGERKLLDAIIKLFPSPADTPAVTETGERVEADAAAPWSAFVFKTVVDPYAGHLSFLRIRSGTLKPDCDALNATRSIKEKIGPLLRVLGKTYTPVSEAVAGEIVMVAKLKDTHINHTLCDAKRAVKFPAMKFPAPVASYAIHPHSQKDEEKFSSALHRFAEEDPTFRVERSPETKELVISGMGENHLAIILDIIKKKLGIQVDLSPPKVAYKETINSIAEGHHKHKKQSGGHGQYGEVYLRIEPLPRGSGFEFVNAIKGGVIPTNYIPACEKGVREALSAGVLASYPVEDVRVIVHFGSYHDVDSSELSFKIAAAKAFRDAMSKAKAVLLEPIMTVTVTAPDNFMGDITGDLNHKRGRILGVEAMDGMQVIKASVPQAELFKYSSELRSMTGGRGSFEMEFDRYEIVPSNIAQKVIAERAALKKAEQEE
jgi:elongation factor G